MDIWQFLLGSRIRATVILAVPILAALLAALLTLLSPPRYVAEVAITLPQLPDDPLSESELEPLADLVMAALTRPQIVGGPDASELTDVELEVGHEDGSRLINFSVEASEPDVVTQLPEDFARGVLRSILAQDVVAADERLSLVEEQYRAARTAMDDVVDRAGVEDVDDEHDRFAERVTQERAESAADTASGNTEGAIEASTRADLFAERRAELAPLLAEYGRARDALDHAGVLRVRATEALQDAEALLRTVDEPTIVSAATVQQQSNNQRAVRNAAIALAISGALIILAWGIHDAFAEPIQPRERQSRRRESETRA